MKSSIPDISVSPAPPEAIPEEPYSPFSSASFVIPDVDDEFRPHHLTPPPTPRFPRQLSPLRPPDSPVVSSGLKRERFEALLRASKERSAAAGTRKAADLRKEIALKAYKSKQVERRALFLSKLQAPPSPSAVSLPKTPPDSPAIFHYTLPSPGLNSPLALFDALSHNTLANIGLQSVEPWVEQVDFRLLEPKPFSRSAVFAVHTEHSKLGKPMPSLDQISAHLSSHGSISSVSHYERSPLCLPAFLSSPSAESSQAAVPTDAVVAGLGKQMSRPPIGVGRLQMPGRLLPASSPQPSTATFPGRCTTSTHSDVTVARGLQVTTIVPQSATLSSANLSEHNVCLQASRVRTAKDMLSTLKRRTHPSEEGPRGHGQDEEDRMERRRSSPAEMQPTGRSGFTHPVLSIPGGF